MNTTNNNLIKIQEMLMRQMERLDDNTIMDLNGKEEVARGNALSQSAVTFLKSVNIGIRVLEMSDRIGTKKEDLNNQLGITDEK